MRIVGTLLALVTELVTQRGATHYQENGVRPRSVHGSALALPRMFWATETRHKRVRTFSRTRYSCAVGSQASVVGLLTAIGAIGAAAIALWAVLFGSRRVTRPKLSVTLRMEPPECMAVYRRRDRTTARPSVPDYYVIRPQVENHGNEDARNVEVKMHKLWLVNDHGQLVTDRLFLPLVLPWSWWPSPSLPVTLMHKLVSGMPKHFDLLVVTRKQPSQAASKWRRYRGLRPGSTPYMAFQHACNFPYGSSEKDLLCKPPGQYQLDIVVSASNAETLYQTAHINFKGWRDGEAEMFREGGGLNIRMSETPQARRPGKKRLSARAL